MPAITKPNQHFDATLYTGTGATQTITNAGGFQPDWVWIKRRDGGQSHQLYDVIRGVTKAVYSNLTSAEATEANGLSAFTSSGFTVISDIGVNTSGGTYVGWNWKAGGTAVTNTSGTISSQVSANPTAGFSVVTYTGTGVTATIGHGLGVAPSMIIVKNRSAVESWRVGHSFMNGGSSPWNYYMNLNGTGAQVSEASIWNNTAPTSSVFTISNDSAVSGSGNSLVAYCFAPIAGYSAFGSYKGNGSTTDGPFVYTGFRPKFVMIKDSTNAATQWTILDSSRNTSNIVNLRVMANLTNSENTESFVDFLSNGFKVRPAFETTINTTSANLIYMAFAEAPFKYANAR
jgi:hypothetical protein